MILFFAFSGVLRIMIRIVQFRAREVRLRARLPNNRALEDVDLAPFPEISEQNAKSLSDLC